MAIIAAASLSGCFSSRAPLLTAAQSVKLFGDRGAATRIEFGPANAPTPVFFVWNGDSYALDDPRERRNQALYRVAPMGENWLMTERIDGGGAVYGLARREGDRLWTYSPACQDLSDADRAALNLTLEPFGTCIVSSREQLRAALKRFTLGNPHPDGYFELVSR